MIVNYLKYYQWVCDTVSDAMVVKDILQGLVDDGLVESDRIGTSNYYWAFPSKTQNAVSQSMRY